MKLTLLLPPKYDERKWRLTRQMGVTHIITKATTELSGKPAPYDFSALQAIQNDFIEAGFHLYGLEGDQFDMAPIKLGLPNRDETIDRYCQMLENMDRLDIRLLCYSFMAGIGWFRTRVDVLERGGALTSEFKLSDVEQTKTSDGKGISEAELWENLFYFLDAVIPVAEKHGIKMALHPDDPPLSPLRGFARILTSAKAFEEIQIRYPPPAHGITFCQATFKLMGEDIQTLSRKWLKEKRIFFIHLRDVRGDKYDFRETFHDNGPTTLAQMLQHYHRCGFDGPLRPDHAPAMAGEGQGRFHGDLSAGYEMKGKIFAVGMIKGVCQADGIPLE